MFSRRVQRLEQEYATWASGNFEPELNLAARAVAKVLHEQLGVTITGLKRSHGLHDYLAVDELEMTGIQLHFAEEMGIQIDGQELKTLTTIDDFVKFIHRKIK